MAYASSAPSASPKASAPARQLRPFPAIVLFAAAAFILADNVVNIGKGIEDLTKFYIIWRLSPLDFALGVLLAWGVAHVPDLQRYLWRPAILGAAGAVLVAVCVGLVRASEVAGATPLLFEVRILLCLLGGVIMGSIMVKTGQFTRLVAILALLATALIVFSALANEDFQKTLLQGAGKVRVTDPNVFYYWEFLLIPCGLLGIKRRSTGLLERIAFVLSLAALVYLGVVVSATRSCFFVIGILVVLLTLARLKRAKVQGLKRVVIFLVLLGGVGVSYYFVRTLFKPAEVGSVSAFEKQLSSFAMVDRVRGETGESTESLNYRGEEVRQLLQEMTPVDYVIGKGLGATIATPEVAALVETVGISDRTHTLHISIFNFLFKFGGIAFAVVLFLVMWKWPSSFVRALLREGSDASGSTVLVTYPAVGAATSLMFMSGGYTVQMFLWFGIAYAYHVDLQRQRAMAREAERLGR